jgi:tagaturonate reductase
VMNLSKENLGKIRTDAASIPDQNYFQLPEKVLQFGTGVLLRGLPDYFIDKANKKGVFNGRIVIVKSTDGDSDAFDRQNGLYTLCVRGVEAGVKTEENIINASISRVLSAKTEWEKILETAANPDMQMIISNTTEIGITLVNEDVLIGPPQSFPGKLLAFLYRRYTVFNGATDKGMVIIPTELIPDNGEKLEAIVEELAHLNKFEYAFLDWLENCNYFCSSLVDRIVPGKLPQAQQQEMEKKLGYTDELMIMAEVYRLWAIEASDPRVKEVLSFAAVDKGVVIAPDIELYRELKLRLLNGSHTFGCGLAFLAGFSTVKEAMKDKDFCHYIRDLMLQEIAPAIAAKDLTLQSSRMFASSVLDRFENPYLEHQWLSITVQFSAKMKMRNIPLLLKYYEDNSKVPELMALGFAGFIAFMKPIREENGKYWGEINKKPYPINDDNAGLFREKWEAKDPDAVVKSILGDSNFWGEDLSKLPGFETAVTAAVQHILQKGVVYNFHEDGLLKISGVNLSKAR